MKKKITIAFTTMTLIASIMLVINKGDKQLSQRRVTDSKIAIGNLNSQIDSLSRIVKAKPTAAKYRLQLMNLMLMKMQFLGSYEEFHTAQELVFKTPKTNDEYLVNINFYMATHQFTKVNDLINKITPELKERMKISLNLALGQNLQESKEQLTEILKINRSFSNLLTMANIQIELGFYNEADTLYDEALSIYKDTSPFPIALVYFQKGVLWGEKAFDPQKAMINYQHAVHFLPEFSSAQIHLAELYIESNEIDKAVEGMSIIANNGDPEVRGTLGEIYLKMGNQNKSDIYRNQADIEYRKMLSDFEEAFLDHAAEFYMASGSDYKLAMNLAMKNWDNRKNQRAYLLALEATQLAQNKIALCTLVDSSHIIKVTHHDLLASLKHYREACSSI